MATHRIVDIFVNVSKQKEVVDADTMADVSTPTLLTRFEQVLLRWNLLNDAGEAFKIDAGSTFLFGIDSTPTSGHADLVLSDNAQFNISGDWGDASIEEGRICNRADLATVDLATDLGSAKEKDMYACLWSTPAGGKPFLLAQIPVKVRNVYVEPGPPTSVPAPADIFLTIAAADVRLSPRVTIQPREHPDEAGREQLALAVDGKVIQAWDIP